MLRTLNRLCWLTATTISLILSGAWTTAQAQVPLPDPPINQPPPPMPASAPSGWEEVRWMLAGAALLLSAAMVVTLVIAAATRKHRFATPRLRTP